MARATRIPGAIEAPAQQAQKEEPRDPREVRAGLPDFREMSCDAVIAWFKEHPEAPRRNVLTAEGVYVHPVGQIRNAPDLLGR